MPTASDVASSLGARPRRALLSDGTPVLVEALGPGDADVLLDLHLRLSERDRWLRFGTVHPGRLDD
jgi:hypothetical protein